MKTSRIALRKKSSIGGKKIKKCKTYAIVLDLYASKLTKCSVTVNYQFYILTLKLYVFYWVHFISGTPQR